MGAHPARRVCAAAERHVGGDRRRWQGHRVPVADRAPRLPLGDVEPRTRHRLLAVHGAPLLLLLALLDALLPPAQGHCPLLHRAHPRLLAHLHHAARLRLLRALRLRRDRAAVGLHSALGRQPGRDDAQAEPDEHAGYGGERPAADARPRLPPRRPALLHRLHVHRRHRLHRGRALRRHPCLLARDRGRRRLAAQRHGRRLADARLEPVRLLPQVDAQLWEAHARGARGARRQDLGPGHGGQAAGAAA
mmetsp:Transcript_54977/g.144472  ORF Transcript_54977/g.144472 Transcript_54977/m.144472 type:complete len:248 (+) Transcript_54977:1816-2559(+)